MKDVMFGIAQFIALSVVQGTPLLFGSTGEILTEKSGNLNLGIPGIMYIGAISGIVGGFFYHEQITTQKIFGVALCIAGVVMLSF